MSMKRRLGTEFLGTWTLKWTDTLVTLRKRRKKLLKRFGKGFIQWVGDYMVRQSTMPVQPVFKPQDFPWVAELESNYEVIRTELEGVLEHRRRLPRLHDLQGDQYRISADDKWKTFVLCGWGFQAEEGMRLCPQSVRIVNQIPGLETAFFSILEPGAHIPEHRGFLKSLLRGQLAMVVPEEREKCVIHIAGKPHYWTEGKTLIFDDTFLHEVRNDTPQDRIVLILHFLRPMNWRGRFVHRTLTAILRRTYFVKDAKRNYARWAKQFRKDAQ